MDTNKQSHLWDQRQVKRARDEHYQANRARLLRIVATVDRAVGSRPRKAIRILNIGVGDARLEGMLLDRGYDVDVLAYEDGVLLTAKAQRQHDDPIWKDKPEHHTDAGKAHSTTAEFVERLLEKGKGEPHLTWYV